MRSCCSHFSFIIITKLSEISISHSVTARFDYDFSVVIVVNASTRVSSITLTQKKWHKTIYIFITNVTSACVHENSLFDIQSLCQHLC